LGLQTKKSKSENIIIIMENKITTERKIKDYVLKISGKVSLLEPIEIDNNYKVEIEGSIISEKDKSEEDGTFLRYYEFKPILVRLLDNIGKTIKAKDVRSLSQKFRAIEKFDWEQSGESYEFEVVYEALYNYLISHHRELFDLTIKTLKG